MAALLTRQALRFGIHRMRVVHQVALATVKADGRDLLRAGGARHHGNERQAQQAREVGFADGRAAAGGFHHRGSFMQPAVAQGVQKKAARQAVLQAAGGVAGLIFQVQIDARETRQRQRDQVGVAAALVVGFDAADGFMRPRSTLIHGALSSRHVRWARNQFGIGADFFSR